MPGDDGGGDEWAFSEWQDYVAGRHARENDAVHPHAAEVERPTTRRTLTAVRGAFERAERRGWIKGGWPESGRIDDLRAVRAIRAHHATERSAEAIRAGDGKTLRAMIGSQEDPPDLSSLRTIQTIKDVLTGDAALTYVFGHMGNGKSFAASLFAEIWKSEMGERAEVASNTRTIDAARYLGTWGELQDWMIEDEEIVLAGDARPKLFIFDEASSVASGRGKDGYEASTKLATMCYKIRKYGGMLIIIGHDGKDVHPAVREMCVAFHKTGTKTGQFFRDVKNRKGHDPITDPLEGIPVPSPEWQPNTYDTANWSWKADGGEIDPEEVEEGVWLSVVRTCYEEGLSARQAADYVRYSRDWTSRRYRWLEQGEFPHGKADAALEGIA